MSVYVISDIHGNNRAYMEMLKKINFSYEDTLYVLGDIIDRGKHGIKILQDMMLRYNVIPILGNHEYMMYSCMDFLLSEVNDESIAGIEEDVDTLESLLLWMNDGGNTTIDELQKLSVEEREEVIDYLSGFSLYETVRVNNKDFILVHAGLKNFDKHRPLSSYRIDELIFEPSNYDKVYFEDKYLVTGHVPTRIMWGGVGKDGKPKAECKDKIYINNNHIAIDCASAYSGGSLGCLRLDDMKEFYVKI